MAKIVLTDPTLFGNDAAEDEKDEIFFSYAMERPDFEPFLNKNNQLSVARAYKGEGKSALLRLVKKDIFINDDSVIDVSKTASEIVPEVQKEDYTLWIRSWKASILSMFANEIGSRIGVAWTDDAMSLVEEAEKTGFKRRSLLSSILDRLKLPEIRFSGAELTLPERKILGTVNPTEAVKRWARGKVNLWLYIDDVDKNFENTKNMKIKLASYFDACRELTNKIPELHIRTVIRPNVWSIIRQEYESLSLVEQYMHDLSWTEEEIRELLAKRISGYLARTGQWVEYSTHLPENKIDREKSIISTVFMEKMPWGGGGKTRPPHVIIYTLSKHRPRWIIELAKASAKGAVQRRHERIMHEDIIGELTTFGRRRIVDTVAEFSSQCPQIDEIVAAFSREKEQLTTADLLKIIDNKILAHISVIISGVTGKVTNVNIAHLLYEIGFIFGRRDNPDGSYEHITYSDNPSLLRARTALDVGMNWEIHPVYRQALEIRDASGRVRSIKKKKY